MGVKVKMVGAKNGKTTRKYKYKIEDCVDLGKALHIPSNSHATLNEAGFSTKFYVDTVSVTIGIGTDHVADLIMSKDAWEALKAGEKVEVTTTEEFKERFL